MIRTLIVGGTGFLGVEIARAALAHSHQVSILTRGPTVPIPGVTTITADRFEPLDMLQDQDFDLVFLRLCPQSSHASAAQCRIRPLCDDIFHLGPSPVRPARFVKGYPGDQRHCRRPRPLSGRAFCRLGQRSDERRRLWPAETCLRTWPQSRLWRTKRSCCAPGCWWARATAVTG